MTMTEKVQRVGGAGILHFTISLIAFVSLGWALANTPPSGFQIDVSEVMNKIMAATGFNQETLSAVVGWLAGSVVYHLTALAKHYGKTTGVNTVVVSNIINALIVGVGGYMIGLYGQGTTAILNALLACVLAFVKASGAYRGRVQAGQDAIKTEEPIKVTPAPRPPIGPQ